MKARLALVAAILAALFCMAQSPMSAFPPGMFDNKAALAPPSAAYQGPGDIYSTSVFGWYGIRAYSLATAGNKSVNACNPANTCADLSTNTAGNLSFSGSIGGSACSVSISSGTYVTATGALVLTTSAGVTSFASGSNFALSGLTGTGGFASINGVWQATTGTTGTTVNATVTTGLGTTTITGGTVSVCPIATAYEQSGGGAPDLTQATIAGQPILVVNCDGSLPCLGFNKTLSSELTGTITGFSAATVSLSAVAERIQSVTSTQGIMGTNSNFGLYYTTSANTLLSQFGTGGTASVTANDGQLNAIQATNSAGTCVSYANGSSGSGSCATGATSGTTLALSNFGGAFVNYLSGRIAEAGIFKSTMGATAAGNVCHNQYLYYSISGATC